MDVHNEIVESVGKLNHSQLKILILTQVYSILSNYRVYCAVQLHSFGFAINVIALEFIRYLISF